MPTPDHTKTDNQPYKQTRPGHGQRKEQEYVDIV